MFGGAADAYNAGRKPFPQSIIDFVLMQSSLAARTVLDVGCGTGIASRQLAAKAGQVVGSDIDPEMVRVARLFGRSNLEYVVGSALALPFGDAIFDLVTAFSAFHWFAEEQSYKEICRVLKPDCRFAVVNKTERGDFEITLRRVLKPFASTPMPEPKPGYHPRSLLASIGASDIVEFSVDVVESFSKRDAVAFLRSQSIMNLVDIELRAEAERALGNWIDAEVQKHGYFHRYLSVDAISCIC